jgi:hypothetical protein
LPSVPQVEAAVVMHIRRGSALPAGVSVHRPSIPGEAQVRQVPVQASLQHTPSTQLPFWQSVPAVQSWPSTSFDPQLLFTQGWPSSQSASVAQTDGQSPLTQRKFPQSLDCGAVQVPSPSQVRAPFMVVAAGQVAEPHTVAAGNFAQVPKPSHSPVVPQVVDARAGQTASACPAGMGEQVPSRVGRPQERQSPVQAELQQYPSTQWVEAQSTSALQLAPFIFGPQVPATHLMPALQLASLTQLGEQAFVVGSQENGAQMRGAAITQAWVASHSKVAPTESPSHVPPWQGVPTTYLSQWPIPSQVPSCPQVDGSAIWHSAAERGRTVAGTAEHVPRAVGSPQDMQVPVQALLQQ